MQPQIGAGGLATNALSGLLGLNGSTAGRQAFDQFRKSSNYDFVLNQGLKGVSYSNAPTYGSGGAAKALNNYAQGQAGNALSGYEAMLAGQSSLGANTALGLGQIGSGIAQQVASANNSSASAQGGAALNGANAFGNAFGDLSKLFGQQSGQSSFGGPGLGSSGGITYGQTGLI